MNYYEADIWCSVYHSGQFSHTATRLQLVHAMNEEQAKKKIKLNPERIMGKPPYEVKASAEAIYRLEKGGTVTIQPYYVYSGSRSPRPVKESHR